MKLEVGMYARTKKGYICKIININDFREPSMKYGVEVNYLKDVMFIGDDDVVKASYNIIDILEEVANDNYETIPFEALFINKEIETIVTHEQMEQMAYKVGE